MKRGVVLLVVLLMCVIPAVYAQMPVEKEAGSLLSGGDQLDPSSVTADSLLPWIEEGYDASIDDDGDIRISDGDYYCFITIDMDKQLLRFWAAWTSESNVSDSRAYKLMNQWNRDKVFATAYYENTDYYKMFSLEYYLPYNAGVLKGNCTNAADWMFALAYSFDDFLSEEDAL